mmetsp:Transcript_28311/g.86565  ORF Transcript_28311/g.86565 Transcript_28311/m.86565 type:complete len:338 (+) Transcript_28311:861-1874(+)
MCYNGAKDYFVLDFGFLVRGFEHYHDFRHDLEFRRLHFLGVLHVECDSDAFRVQAHSRVCLVVMSGQGLVLAHEEVKRLRRLIAIQEASWILDDLSLSVHDPSVYELGLEPKLAVEMILHHLIVPLPRPSFLFGSRYSFIYLDTVRTPPWVNPLEEPMRQVVRAVHHVPLLLVEGNASKPVLARLVEGCPRSQHLPDLHKDIVSVTWLLRVCTGNKPLTQFDALIVREELGVVVPHALGICGLLRQCLANLTLCGQGEVPTLQRSMRTFTRRAAMLDCFAHIVEDGNALLRLEVAGGLRVPTLRALPGRGWLASGRWRHWRAGVLAAKRRWLRSDSL